MPTITESTIRSTFDALVANEYAFGASTAKQRKALLKKFITSVNNHKSEIRTALHKEYNKPAAEVDLTEIFPLTSEVKHINSKLDKWMARKPVDTPLSMFGSSSFIQYEPKGVSLIIAPWNYPFQLLFMPMVSAIAAGNPCVLKPSEHTPNINAVIKKIVNEVFNENEVVVIEGGVELTTELLKLPFRHIFFTGAPEIGKIVMRAAAENLASVTLELGGKSPTIIDETADINKAALRIGWTKFSNNGQICLAPDYILVNNKVKAKFEAALQAQLKSFYGNDPSQSQDYMRIINLNHFHRLSGYLKDAVERGATILTGGQTKENENYIAPTLLTNVSMDATVMQKEIFGPILPIIGWDSIDECISIIRRGEKPLGLYIYSRNKKNIDKVLNSTRSGGVCINNSAVHYFNPELPFGGVNNSGIGKTGGWYGFEAFSNAKSVLKQNMPSALERLMPPYTDAKQKLIDLTVKWF